MGAFFVFGTTLVAPKIGLINMFIIVLIGQLIMGLIFDKIGGIWFGNKAYIMAKNLRAFNYHNRTNYIFFTRKYLEQIIHAYSIEKIPNLIINGDKRYKKSKTLYSGKAKRILEVYSSSITILPGLLLYFLGFKIFGLLIANIKQNASANR